MTFALQEELEELRKKRDEALKAEEETPEEEAKEKETQVPEPEEQKQEEEAKKDEEEEPPKAEPEPVVQDDSAFARMRREKAASEKKALEAEKKARELEERLAALESAKQSPEAEEPETIISPVIQEMVTTYQMSRAEQELAALEEGVRKTIPDYDGVTNEYAKGMFQALRIQNPRMSAQQLAEMTKHTLLIKAANYQKEGYNPAEALYYEAKELGFSAPVEAPKEVVKEPKKADLDKIASNKERNAGFTGAAGRSGNGGEMTREYLASLPAHEYLKIPAETRKRIINGG